MVTTPGKRIAILGLHLESNAFAPTTTEADFRSLCYLEGEAIMVEARKPAPAMPAEVPGFAAVMDGHGPWQAAPIIVAAAEPGGPIEHGFFLRLIEDMRRRLAAAGGLDAVYISNHGGMCSTADPDPDGQLYAMVRGVVGPGVPIVATVDLHANVSDAMIANCDVLVSYLTNPHVDQEARGAEAAHILIELMAGTRARSAFIRLPITPATISLLTAAGPYADLIARGQAEKSPDILNVSVVGGFVYCDTPKNGIAIVVTARNEVAPARRLALALARQCWAERWRFVKAMTSLDAAVELARAAGADPALRPLIYSDAGDNPGGGGRGNTTELLAALHRAEAKGVLYGVFIDGRLAAEAHRLGVGAEFLAAFNRGSRDATSPEFSAPARVMALHDGRCVGRRGLWVGKSLALGPTAALDLGGITVVVATMRKQCADPIFFEMMGLSIGKARCVVVKSRGHFRAGFDEFFGPEQVREVDTRGLTSPNLANFAFKGLPRPVFPLDPSTEWREPDWAV
jgi:microcystin degradation protein MlrC